MHFVFRHRDTGRDGVSIRKLKKKATKNRPIRLRTRCRRRRRLPVTRYIDCYSTRERIRMGTMVRVRRHLPGRVSSVSVFRAESSIVRNNRVVPSVPEVTAVIEIIFRYTAEPFAFEIN